ncbi:MAG TPA: formate--tetrahydrofolate ligase [Dehalococcoidia bacterium]|nr:formate--tetrahydrofolate ligase [Dehalococcoidia bacterium]
MKTDLEIAQEANLKPISEIAAELGLLEDEVELYGKYKAKVSLGVLGRLQDRPDGKLVVVTGMTPTPLGEGKTLTTVGLAQAMNRIGRRTIATIRQPSLGPTFGIKGGAAGGGYSQVVPMEDFNLHLTGDTHAVSMAHNLLAAMIDNHLNHGNQLGIDPFSISWPRVVDISDRALRKVIVGLGGKANGYPRETSFDIAVASEVMAVLGLSTSLADLRERLGRIVVAQDGDRKPITASDLKASGAMTVLLRDAIKPNLLQTLEHTPVFVHTGPFGNIAHGNSSVLADQIGLKLADFVVTESGFGSDMGFEKFIDIKCRHSGLRPAAAVIVATVRALKAHSGKYRIVAGRPLDPKLGEEDLEAVEAGMGNLVKHIENVTQVGGLPAVVCINRFSYDSESELELVRKRALEAGADACEVSEVWEHGGAGGEALARALVAAADKPNRFRFIYELDAPIEEKIEAIATKLYGADGVDFSQEARRQIRSYTEWGLGNLPVCMAKTQYSLSADGNKRGRPTGFRVNVREVRPAAGAGFLIAYLGEISTMPGLPSEPAANHVDIDERGFVRGLF